MTLCLIVLKNPLSPAHFTNFIQSYIYVSQNILRMPQIIYIVAIFLLVFFIAILKVNANVECKLRNARYETNDIINMRHITSCTIRNAFKCSDYNIRMILQWIRIASIRQNKSTVKMQYTYEMD